LRGVEFSFKLKTYHVISPTSGPDSTTQPSPISLLEVTRRPWANVPEVSTCQWVPLDLSVCIHLIDATNAPMKVVDPPTDYPVCGKRAGSYTILIENSMHQCEKFEIRVTGRW